MAIQLKNLQIFLLTSLAWMDLSCKSLPQGSAVQSNVTPTKARKELPEVSFYRPFAPINEDSVKEQDLVRKISEAGVDLTGHSWKTVMLAKETPERLLFVIEGQEILPVASLEGTTLHPWSQTTTASSKGNGEVTMQSTNIFYRHASMGDYDPLDDEVYFMYHNKDDSYDAVAMTSFSITSGGMLRRRGNQFLDEDGLEKFGFKPIRENVWGYQGSFSNGVICQGAVFWRVGDDYYHAVKQYNLKKVYVWHADGDVLRLDDEADVSIPDEATQLRECPGKSPEEVKTVINSLKYDPETKLPTTTVPVQLDTHTSYALGQKVIVDNSIFVMLYMGTEQYYVGSAGVGAPGTSVDINTYYLTNLNRTYQEDKGLPYTRIYKYSINGLTEVAKTPSVLIALAKVVQDISSQRIQASKDVDKAQENGRWYLKNAETKANQLDSPAKLMVAVASTYVWELTKRSFDTKRTSVMGIKNIITAGKGTSIAKAALSAPELKQRILASVYLTIVGGVTSSAWTATVSWDKRTPKQQWDNFVASIVQNGTANGMRSFFQTGSLKWVSIGLAGFGMCWRKLSTDNMIGYDNGGTFQQAANLTIGTAIFLVNTMAQIKGASPGVTGAIGQGGSLLSDIIAGRGSPGVILGTSIEIAVNLWVPDPYIRPFAIVLSREVSSIIQSLEAVSEITKVGRQIDAARALRYEQIAKRDALLWLVRANPAAFDTLSIEGRNHVIATIVDPYAGMKQYYLKK